MAERRNGTAAPGTHSVVRTEEWDEGAGAEKRHERVAFVDLDLCETTLQAVEFQECTFRDVRFNCSAQTDVAFVNCTFVNCSFFDATFTRCKLVGSMFDRCTYDIMTVEDGDWSFVGLPRAALGTATFTGVRMREADLTGARCQGATFRGVDLSGASLRGADFTRADLRGTDLSALDPAITEIRHAIITADQAVVVAMALGLDVRPA
ncbi:pentapeptide repeat-containing protein [Actinoplanes sp. NPDC004185]